jgi:DNA-binding CsgD family transcriptional regulator
MQTNEKLPKVNFTRDTGAKTLPLLPERVGYIEETSVAMSGTNMNIPRNVFSPTVSNSTSQSFEWTDRPGQNLISDPEWAAVKSYARLSLRESQVSRLLFEGHKRDQIAEMLGISPRTVRYHLESLHKKLKVNTRVGLVLRLIQLRDFLVHRSSPVTSSVSSQYAVDHRPVGVPGQ